MGRGTLEVLILTINMAIAFINQTSASNSGASSLTFTGPTVSGSNTIGFVSVMVQTNLTINTVTWGGVACTNINGLTEANFGVERLELWYIVNPSSAGSIVISRTGNTNALEGKATSYSGASQTGQPDASVTKQSSGVTSMTATLTTIANNCWTVINARSDVANLTAGAGTTLRGSYVGHGVFDSNAALPAGSTSLIVSDGSGAGDIWGCMASFSPVGGGAIAGDGLLMVND